VQKKASEDTRRQEQKISNAADYVTEKVAEVKETIVKSTPDWTSDAKHKAEEAAKHTHLKDYGK
jgi:vacuolar-type H+-ATPase subunit E/Vma4